MSNLSRVKFGHGMLQKIATFAKSEMRKILKSVAHSFIAEIFGKSQESLGLSRATVGGTRHRERSGGRCVQDDGGAKVKADRCTLGCGQIKRNGGAMFGALL